MIFTGFADRHTEFSTSEMTEWAFYFEGWRFMHVKSYTNGLSLFNLID
jgi:hypothetical protein